jgi:hypothetical protein
MGRLSNQICSIECQQFRLKAIGKTGLLLLGNMNFFVEKCGGGGPVVLEEDCLFDRYSRQDKHLIGIISLS